MECVCLVVYCVIIVWFVLLVDMFLFYPTYNSIVILYSMFDTVDWVSMEDI